jgi:hypothetical protein
MNENEEQAETFNHDQQEMFQNPDAKIGETRPRTPGAQSVPLTPPPSADATDAPPRNLDGTEIT